MGPVIPLTGTPKDKDKESDSLLGAPGSSPIPGDAIATKVLEKGETLAAPLGRADNFAWPNGSQAQAAAVAAETPIVDQPKPGRLDPAKGCACSDRRFSLGAGRHEATGAEEGSAGKHTQQKPAKNSTPPQVTEPRPPQEDVPRPPMPIGPSGSPFGPRR
jgi:hypothetical protein